MVLILLDGSCSAGAQVCARKLLDHLGNTRARRNSRNLNCRPAFPVGPSPFWLGLLTLSLATLLHHSSLTSQLCLGIWTSIFSLQV